MKNLHPYRKELRSFCKILYIQFFIKVLNFSDKLVTNVYIF